MPEAETKVLSIGGRYRPLYRLSPDERWCFIRRDKKPVECETAYQAKKLADELVEAITSPAHLIEEDVEPLGNIEERRRNKAQRAVDERRSVFGDETSRTVHRLGKPSFTVEIARKRRRA